MAQGQFICPEHLKCPWGPTKGLPFVGAGQNARLAAKLTGYKIDIKPASAPAGEPEEKDEELFAGDKESGEE